jgi:hypothetical protein
MKRISLIASFITSLSAAGCVTTDAVVQGYSGSTRPIADVGVIKGNEGPPSTRLRGYTTVAKGISSYENFSTSSTLAWEAHMLPDTYLISARCDLGDKFALPDILLKITAGMTYEVQCEVLPKEVNKVRIALSSQYRTGTPRPTGENKTCYAKDDLSKWKADEKMLEAGMISDTLPKNPLTAEEQGMLVSQIGKYLKLVREASLLGHTDAMRKSCEIGKDRKAPLNMRLDGSAWCRIGAKMIPQLREAFEADADTSLGSEVDKRETTIMEEMCKM